MLPQTVKVTDFTGIGTSGWAIRGTSCAIPLEPPYVQHLREILGRWLQLDHPESTWLMIHHYVPTLLIRFDCTTVDGQPAVYEIEERPQGPGSIPLYNRTFAERLAKVQCSWPDFVSVETPGHLDRGGSDDNLWVPQIPLDQLGTLPSETLLLVRSEPHELAVQALAGRSVAPIRTEGDKRYGVDLGWWKLVSDPDELPWDTSFVLKPVQGSKFGSGTQVVEAQRVVLWTGPRKSETFRPGSSTRSQIATALAKGPMYCQPYHPPMEVTVNGEHYFLMYRPYFGLDLGAGDPLAPDSWQYLGGEWVMDPSIRLHGTSRTIFGALV